MSLAVFPRTLLNRPLPTLLCCALQRLALFRMPHVSSLSSLLRACARVCAQVLDEIIKAAEALGVPINDIITPSHRTRTFMSSCLVVFGGCGVPS